MANRTMFVGKTIPISSDRERRQQVCKIGRMMYDRGLIVACEGNLSVRLDRETILVTPRGACKGRLRPEDLLITNLEGVVVAGSGQPSSEIQMHLLYYRLRRDVGAVCHGHPPTATGFATAGYGLDEPVLPELVGTLGAVPLAPYETPGTRELCVRLEAFVLDYDAVLLENHGVVTCGHSLEAAYEHLETVEHCARIILAAKILGGPRLMSSSQVAAALDKRPTCSALKATR